MNDQQATVHLRVPAETKARWVKAAQAEGLKLSEWIVRAVAARLSEAPATERRMNNGAGRITVSLEGWQDFLSPADLRRRDIKWLGVVRRDDGQVGALGLSRFTGMLVQVNAGAVRTLDQREVLAALMEARRLLQDPV